MSEIKLPIHISGQGDYGKAFLAGMEYQSKNMISIDSPEDIQYFSEILIFDGCDFHIDYVEVDSETGNHYMANNTSPISWMHLPEVQR